MRRVLLILVLIALGGMLYSTSNFEKYYESIQKRQDLFWGIGEAESQSEASEICRNELAKFISTWYLAEIGLEKQISYGNRDKYERMVRVWLSTMMADINIEQSNDKDHQEIWTISKASVNDYYDKKMEDIKLNINRGRQALELNKLGIFFRCFYEAIVEIDLLAGKEVIIDDQVWDADALIAGITKVVENMGIKLVGNSYEAGNRRLIWQVLYERRPVNDIRLGILTGEDYKYYSISDRYLQIDLFGYQYAEIDNINFKIDIQDSATHAWGKVINELSNITGMNGYEAYRTIPLRKVEYEESNWKDVRLPVTDDEAELENRLRVILASIETDSGSDSEIFSSEQVQQQFICLQQKLKLSNMVVEPGVKRYEYGDRSMWRGFDVQVQYASGLQTMTNLVLTTDSEDKISGVWLGMKPLDFRLINRKIESQPDTNKLLSTVELIEEQYTEAICGEQLTIDGYPESPSDGWYWVELEDINVDVMENGVVYNYRLIISGAERSWEFDLKGIKD
ncbi:MAG: hypothetical protein P9X26_04240 [Candidatus Stygibacter frigidus]|nr:hypothetical protein [Candidatus Stygibacter frigidus]